LERLLFQPQPLVVHQLAAELLRTEVAAAKSYSYLLDGFIDFFSDSVFEGNKKILETFEPERASERSSKAVASISTEFWSSWQTNKNQIF